MMKCLNLSGLCAILAVIITTLIIFISLYIKRRNIKHYIYPHFNENYELQTMNGNT
jgi:hypothetical protein